MKKVFDNVITISLILFVVIEIISVFLLVSNFDQRSSLNYCLYAFLCLIGILGCAYLKKARRIGGLLLCVSCVTFIIYYIHDNNLPLLIASVCYFLLFLILFSTGGVWATLKSGLDYEHMRHTLQLLGCFFIILLACASWILYGNDRLINTDQDAPGIISDDVDFYRLDANDITLAEIIAIEKKYNRMYEPTERDEAFIKRINALKHLYVSGLMVEPHTSSNLENICRLYCGDFSPEQQTIINWFLSLEVYQQKEWDLCPKALSLQDFQLKLKNKIEI